MLFSGGRSGVVDGGRKVRADSLYAVLKRKARGVQYVTPNLICFSSKERRPIHHLRIRQFGLMSFRHKPMDSCRIVAIHQDHASNGDTCCKQALPDKRKPHLPFEKHLMMLATHGRYPRHPLQRHRSLPRAVRSPSPPYFSRRHSDAVEVHDFGQIGTPGPDRFRNGGFSGAGGSRKDHQSHRVQLRSSLNACRMAISTGE
jgi:hypothetical protein